MQEGKMKEKLSVYSLILVGILALLMLIFISVEFLLPVILLLVLKNIKNF